MIFFWVSKRPFDLDEETMWSFEFSLALLGYLMGLGFRFKNNPFFFFPFSPSSSSLFLPMELLVLLTLIFNFLTVVTWNIAVWDFWFENRLKKLAVICLCALFELARTSSSRLDWCFESAPYDKSRLAFLCTLLLFWSSRLAYLRVGSNGLSQIWSFWSSRLLDPRVGSSTYVFWTFSGVPLSSRLDYCSSRLEYISSENIRYNLI